MRKTALPSPVSRAVLPVAELRPHADGWLLDGEIRQLSKATLVAADWVILVTSLPPDAFAAADVLALYRLRCRIELGFKRLKTVVGLKRPPGVDERCCRDAASAGPRDL